MDQVWNIVFAQGATYEETLYVQGIADIGDATEWRLTCAFPDQAPFLIASTENGMILPGTNAAQKIIVIPAETTADFTPGNGRYDLDIFFPDDVVTRIVSNGLCQVNPSVGTLLA